MNQSINTHRRAFTLIEMTTAFLLLAVLATMVTATFTGLNRARQEGAARRQLIRAAEEGLTAAQTRLTPQYPPGVTVNLRLVDAPKGSPLRWAEATASEGKLHESLRGVVRNDWKEVAP